MPPTDPLAPEIQSVLSRLRRHIRRYVVWEGLASVVGVLGFMFWLSFGFDWAFFQLSHLELPRWFRAAILIGLLCVLAATLVGWIALRLARSFRRRALALVLERRFPQLNESVITAVEAAEGRLHAPTPASRMMLERTIAQARSSLDNLELRQVFDQQPLRRAVIVATVMVVSVLGLCVVNLKAMERWVSGYVRLDDHYWSRETELSVVVLTQPGDRKRPFENRVYRHPRGADLTLLVETLPGRKTPEQVRLDYRLGGGRGNGRAYLTPTPDQPMTHTFPALLDRVDVWVRGGDYASPYPYTIEVVQPPALDNLAVAVRYPEYTGLNDPAQKSGLTILPVTGAEIALPLESQFRLTGTSAKPLRNLRMESEIGPIRYEIEVGQAAHSATLRAYAPGSSEEEFTGVVVLKADDGQVPHVARLAPEMVSAILSGDRQQVSLPFLLSHEGETRLPEQVRAANAAKTSLSEPLAFPPDTTVRLYLEDADGIASSEPARLFVRGIVDEPPQVETSLRGIGTSITRLARIPIAGTIVDDYGLGSAAFEYSLDASPEPVRSEFSNKPDGAPREFELARSGDEPYERFDVLPLNLSVKQRISLTVVAADRNDVPKVGPNVGRGQKFVFTIVSNEELLSILYARELNERKRFEQTMAELRGLQADLQKHLEPAGQLYGGGTLGEAERTAAQQAVTAAAERSLQALRQATASSEATWIAFGEIREELVNNGVDTPQMLDRIDRQIRAPLDELLKQNFVRVDESLGVIRVRHEKNTDPRPAMTESIQELSVILERMQTILTEMRKLETFHEALELLKGIITTQEELIEETRKQRKQNALRALEE